VRQLIAFRYPKKVWGEQAKITAANVKLEDFKYSYIFEMYVLFCPAYNTDDIMDQVMKAVNIKSNNLIDVGVTLQGLRNDMPQLSEEFSKLLKIAILGKVKYIAMDLAK
jgi:vacuolar-type H+-ATPase catalytic subunit A/Vma1